MSALNCIEHISDKHSFNCGACKKVKMKAVAYLWYPHPSIAELIDRDPIVLCKNCAMKEEFGNKWKQNKRYKNWAVGI